jgi:CheY-like chemotaxis protein
LESVGRLAAGVAHDFNNILTVIRGHTGLLRSEPNISPAMQESLQQVSRATERAGRLTEQLLTFSQKTMLQPRRLELNEVLSNLGSMLQRTLGEDIRFHFNYGPNLPPVFADLGMLEQIVMNLALNARDAMPQGGELTLSTCLAKVDPTQAARHLEARPGQFICLTVTDSGAGMDAATLAQVFEPFFTTKETGKGTGLGLAVVHGLVLQHQGWIEVQSQLNQGTAFKIYLPPCEHGPEAESAETSPVDGGETVLVVEDEEPVRLIVRNVLQRHGYQVLEAANGLEAMAVWHQHHQAIALLLTDLVMPVGVNGQELADQFRAQKPDLKVVFMSGYSIESAVKHSQPLRGSRFLEKPFDATQLARTIRQALDS